MKLAPKNVIKMRKAVLALVLASSCSPGIVQAKEKSVLPDARPAVVQKLYDCRSIVEPTERLACFDREMAALEIAESDKSVVMLDNQQIKETKRGLFGFKFPTIRLFDNDDDADEVKEIESIVTRAQGLAYGKWMFTLEDGSTWEQSDNRNLVLSPKTGNKVKIKQAALGTYMASVNGQPAIRVRRIE